MKWVVMGAGPARAAGYPVFEPAGRLRGTAQGFTIVDEHIAMIWR